MRLPSLGVWRAHAALAGAAFLVRGHSRVALGSAGLGATSAVGGFLIAAFTDLPTGAVIVLCSSGMILLAALFRRRPQ